MLKDLINKFKIFIGIGIDVTPKPTGVEATATVNDQITDAVTQAPAKKPRAPRKTAKKAD